MKDEDKPATIEQKPVETEADEMTQNPDGKLVLFVVSYYLSQLLWSRIFAVSCIPGDPVLHKRLQYLYLNSMIVLITSFYQLCMHS